MELDMDFAGVQFEFSCNIAIKLALTINHLNILEKMCF